MITCPVCEELAQDVDPGTFDGKIVNCSSCGDYRVTFTALGLLAAKMLEDRTAVLTRAELDARPGNLPEINSSLF
jgi:hypothetical protein